MKEYIVAAVLAAVTLVWVYFIGQGNAQVAYKEHAQEAAIKQLKVDASATAAASVVREKSRAVESIHQEKVNAATSKALSENPDWADERVPDSVIDALGM